LPLELSFRHSRSASAAIATRALSRLSDSAAFTSRAQQLSPLGLSSYHPSGSAAVASRTQQPSPLGLSCYRLSGSAIATRALQLSPLGLSSYCPSGSAAISYHLLGSAAIPCGAQQLPPLGLSSFHLSGSAIGPRALLPLELFTYLALRTSLQAPSPRALLSPLWALWPLGFCCLLSGSIVSWTSLPPLGALGSKASWAPSPLRLRHIACRALCSARALLWPLGLYRLAGSAIAYQALSPLGLCYHLSGSIASRALLSSDAFASGALSPFGLSYCLSGSIASGALSPLGLSYCLSVSIASQARLSLLRLCCLSGSATTL